MTTDSTSYLLISLGIGALGASVPLLIAFLNQRNKRVIDEKQDAEQWNSRFTQIRLAEMDAAKALREEYQRDNQLMREEIVSLRKRLDKYEDDIRHLRTKAESAEERALRAEAHAEVCDERLAEIRHENAALKQLVTDQTDNE